MSVLLAQENPKQEIASEMSEIHQHAMLADVYYHAGATRKVLEELTAIIQRAEWAAAVVRETQKGINQ